MILILTFCVALFWTGIVYLLAPVVWGFKDLVWIAVSLFVVVFLVSWLCHPGRGRNQLN